MLFLKGILICQSADALQQEWSWWSILISLAGGCPSKQWLLVSCTGSLRDWITTIIASVWVSSHTGSLAREAGKLCYDHQGRFSQDFQLRTGSTGAYGTQARKTEDIPLFWNVADPVKPLTSYSAQIYFDFTIWNGLCSAMHGQYILYLVSKERINCIL